MAQGDTLIMSAQAIANDLNAAIECARKEGHLSRREMTIDAAQREATVATLLNIAESIEGIHACLKVIAAEVVASSAQDWSGR